MGEPLLPLTPSTIDPLYNRDNDSVGVNVPILLEFPWKYFISRRHENVAKELSDCNCTLSEWDSELYSNEAVNYFSIIQFYSFFSILSFGKKLRIISHRRKDDDNSLTTTRHDDSGRLLLLLLMTFQISKKCCFTRKSQVRDFLISLPPTTSRNEETR